MSSRQILAFAMALCVSCAGAQPRAPDASAIGGAVVVGSYSVDATRIRAVVYRPGAAAGASPLVLVMHGNHNVCGRPYDPAPVGTDPTGLPCTRPAAGGACMEGIRLDRFNYVNAATRNCGAAPLTEAPSYMGYEYFARRLASRGYVVVSIDANLINARNNSGLPPDRELILARGELALQHLVQLSDWNRNGGAPAGAEIAMGSLDLAHVGLVGHSRGGEAMRAAYNQYRAAASPWPARIVTPVTFEAIYEIGPTDFRGLNASGVTWNVLLPMCDADVSNLQGVRAFDRMMADFGETPARQKSTYTVWGANHNFYNTQWMLSDTADRRPVLGGGTEFFNAFPCRGAGNAALFPLAPGSAAQRLTALSSIPALIRGNVGGAADATFNRNFNTLFALPANVIDEANAAAAYPTRTDRGYSPTANTAVIRVMEDFDRATGTNTSGQANNAAGIVINHINGGPPPAPPGSLPNHDRTLRAAYIQWGAAGPGVMLQSNWTALNRPGIDVSAFATLDFRVSRNNDAARNGAGATNFSIRLVGANGVMTRQVQLSTYAPVANDLRGPVGGGRLADPFHPILQTYRIPLADFGNFAAIGPQVRGVRLTFDQTGTGAIFVANIRFVRTLGAGVTTYSTASAAPAPEPGGADTPGVFVVHIGRIVRLQRFASLEALDGAPGVEILIASDDDFLNRNETAVLGVGGQQFTGSRYPGADSNNLVFTLTESQWAGVVSGEPVRVQYGTEDAAETWDCGTLDKGQLVI